MISCCERGAQWNRALDLFQVGVGMSLFDGLDVFNLNGNKFIVLVYKLNDTVTNNTWDALTW